MDSFTETILSRARERQRLLKDYSNPCCDQMDDKKVTSPTKNNIAPSFTTPVLKEKEPKSTSSSEELFEGERNSNKFELVGSSSSSPVTNRLNIQKENFNMEIKVTSTDNVRVEVEIEESSDEEKVHTDFGLRKDVKNRLNRLGKLYAGGEDANISSPIHRTEDKFTTKCDENKSKAKSDKDSNVTENFDGTKKVGKGLKRLANLAEEINHWEDEVKPKNKAIETGRSEDVKCIKPSAPKAAQPAQKPIRMSMIPSTPIRERINKLNKITQDTPASPEKQTCPKENKKIEEAKLKWDKTVLDTLESQGFKRNTEQSKLTYQYSPDKNQDKKTCEKFHNVKLVENNPPVNKSSSNQSIAEMAAHFEPAPKKHTVQDPSQLSILERKALFEKNKDGALVPKAPLGMAIPVNHNKNVSHPVKPVIIPKLSNSVKTAEVPEDRSSGSEAVRDRSPLKPLQPSQKINTSMAVKKRVNTSESLKNSPKKSMPTSQIGKMHQLIVEEEEEESSEENENKTDEPSDVSTQDEENSPVHRRSGSKRHSMSPKVAAVLGEVKRIKVSPAKPGALYPNLSDIEATTETENEGRSQSTSANNSSIGSYSDDEYNTSFGKEMMETICKNRSLRNRDVYNESTCSDISDVLGDMDNYLDEALASSDKTMGIESSPSKQVRSGDLSNVSTNNRNHSTPENHGNFKSPSRYNASPGDSHGKYTDVKNEEMLPLTHTVSFYRKQTSTTPTSMKQVVRIVEEETIEEDTDAKVISEKIQILQDEVKKQQLIITQTSQALNLCNSTPEFMGSTEQVEAEKVLLLSTHRRLAMLNEIQRLKVEGTLRPQSNETVDFPINKSSLSISKITLPLKKEYVRALAAAGGKGHHVTCLLKSGEEVVGSKLVSTVATDMKNPNYELCIPGDITLKNVYSDSAVTLEIYCLQAQEEILSHEVKYHIKKNKTTPKKSKYDSHLSRVMKESPAGPQVVRSSSFALMGYVVFTLQQVNRKTWSLNNTPAMSPLEGSVEMNISCEIKSSVEHRGFLTMFEDISGFGAWHRRWCLLKGNSLSYWKYPDDERKTTPVNSIDLESCITKEVGPVSREICARPHTFLLETKREALPHDKDTLVIVRKGDKTVIRHLLSADTKEERILWCSKLNSALLTLKLKGKNIQ